MSEGGDVAVVGGVRGSCLTYTVASTGVQNTPRSFLGILWKFVVFQELRVRTQSQDLTEEDKTATTLSDINKHPHPPVYECGKCICNYNECYLLIEHKHSNPSAMCSKTVQSGPTCRRNVIGFWPMAWASPMLALMTSVKGFLTP